MKNLEKLVVASNNKDKLREIKQILHGKFESVLSLAEIGIDIDIEETGETFLENALIKAETICKMINLPVLADDSGLAVEALGGAPGVYSARYAGEPCDHKKNNQKLLAELESASNRRAAFVSVTVIVFPKGYPVPESCTLQNYASSEKSFSGYIWAEGRANGTIMFAPKGDGGFGYDPLFLSDDLNISFAEATAEQKNSVSHRARSLRSLLEKL